VIWVRSCMDDSVFILVAAVAGLVYGLAQRYLRCTNRKRESARRIAGLRTRFPDDSFALVEYPPFVVVTDEEPAEVTMRLENTVPWAIEKLRNMYSWRKPATTVGIWLFNDREHYDTCMKTFYDEKSRWTVGTFMRESNAIVADVSLGNGVLVHEVVHAFIHANFPNCPPWFNEGLASLYDRCSEVNGEMCGHPDRDVLQLQSEICRRAILPVRRLCALTAKQFYTRSESRNYAQARYLCYYLQERGLLKEYYRAFYANHRRDPTGHETLRAIVGPKGMQQFQEDWEALVLAITPPE
jgi:hypothetical protein